MKRLVIAALGLALALAILSPLASKSPDGLDSVAEKQGFKEKETEGFKGPMPDYWDEHGPARKAAAGVIGTLLVFSTCAGLGWALRRKKAG